MAQHPHDPYHPASPVHPVDEKPAARRLVPAALQHIAAMYAGVVTPPLIIGQAVGLDTAGRTRLIAASLLIAGLATLLQTLGLRRFAGNRLPFVNAAGSAGITPMPAIAETTAPGRQLPAIYGAVTVAGGFCRVVGLNLFFHHLGTRSSPRAAVLSAASSGSGTQIP